MAHARVAPFVGGLLLQVLGCTASSGSDPFGVPGDGAEPGGDDGQDGSTGDGGTDGGDGDPGDGDTGDGDTTGDDGTGGGGPMPCGNGVREGSEECDTEDMGDQTCADFSGAGGAPFTGGTLACGVDCKVVTEACTLCGDGSVEGDELCDGPQVGAATCVDMGFEGGSLTCNASCDGLDDSGCFTCGNGTVEGTEDCDGGGVAVTCGDLGFSGDGPVECRDDCTFETRMCCGDGQRAPEEACDCGDGNCTLGLLGFKHCESFDAPNGQPYTGGELACTDTCEIDTSMCGWCGDGTRNEGEACDGSDFGGDTCLSLDFIGGGNLGCNADCTLDTAGCAGPQCGAASAPVGGACPPGCTGGCPDAQTCVVDCQGAQACQDTTITCPEGFNCNIKCVGDEACEGATVIDCPADGDCRLECGGGDSACDGAELNCGLTGLCHTTCDYGSGDQVCWAMGLNCGNNECRVDCTPQSVSFGPSLSCGSSCNCVEGCQ